MMIMVKQGERNHTELSSLFVWETIEVIPLTDEDSNRLKRKPLTEEHHVPDSLKEL